MKTIINNVKIPIESWCDEIDESAFLQAKNLANHQCSFHHVALMPDCHSGYGMPIGGVVAFENAVCSNAVGVDIGCGMVSVRTNLMGRDFDSHTLMNIIKELSKAIPVGFEHNETDQEWDGFDLAPDINVVQQQLASAKRQLCSLGSGNHFIEIQKDDDDIVYIMIHSGSRNIGYKIADYYNKIAIRLCNIWHTNIPNDLAFLPIGSKEAAEYIEAMKFAMSFAHENRKRMLDKAKEILGWYSSDIKFFNEINIHHNFAAIENHFGKNVWVHRKGATRAFKDQYGIIPGSMGTCSYIVKGKGNIESFMSCSHGAGRNSGRNEFCKTHTIEECNKDMEGIAFLGWSKNRKGDNDISEAPKAYKDINSVMRAQKDLVDIEVKLRPLGVLKG